MVTELAVFMYGERVATLTERRGSFTLAYSTSVLAAKGGRPLLTVSMLVQGRGVYRGTVPHAFFNGLLPEGDARAMIAHDLGLDQQDTFGLLTALGRDCAGALVVVPSDVAIDPVGGPEAMGQHDVAERLRRLRFAPLGVDNRVRLSLPGMQEKLLLARTADGWALPVDGAPSTHILKPASPRWPHSIANEAFCMRVAHHLGLVVADVEVLQFEDRPVLVVSRYDRHVDADGTVQRIHQEDLCQANGIESDRKYESRGGPSLQRCCATIRDWAQGDHDAYRLLDTTVLNVALGNADAHAKNFSLLHDHNGRISLAPAYDLMSTTYYPETDRAPGMRINGQNDIEAVTREDLVAEGVSWGLDRRAVTDRLADLLHRVPLAIEQASADVDPPEDLVQLVSATTERLSDERP